MNTIINFIPNNNNDCNKQILNIITDRSLTKNEQINLIDAIFDNEFFERVFHIVIYDAHLSMSTDDSVMIYLCCKQTDLFIPLFFIDYDRYSGYIFGIQRYFLIHAVPIIITKCSPYDDACDIYRYIKYFNNHMDHDLVYKYMIENVDVLDKSFIPIHEHFKNCKVYLEQYTDKMILKSLYDYCHDIYYFMHKYVITEIYDSFTDTQYSLIDAYGINVNKYNEITKIMLDGNIFTYGLEHIKNLLKKHKNTDIIHHCVYNLYLRKLENMYSLSNDMISILDTIRKRGTYITFFNLLYPIYLPTNNYHKCTDLLINCKSKKDYAHIVEVCNKEYPKTIYSYFINNYVYENSCAVYLKNDKYYIINTYEYLYPSVQSKYPFYDNCYTLEEIKKIILSNTNAYHFHIEQYFYQQKFNECIQNKDVYVNFIINKYMKK